MKIKNASKTNGVCLVIIIIMDCIIFAILINVGIIAVKEIIKGPKQEDLKGAFIKYDVEYTDTYMGYEYTSTNGWRLENYELEADGKTLKNVRLISTGVPARMYYRCNDTSNNYSKWVVDETKLNEFKNDVLGDSYPLYTDSKTYYALQASAGFYYNLGEMTFKEKGSGNFELYYNSNQGYYKKIKNGSTEYTSGETTGNNLFVARSDASIRMLTLPELNRALGRNDMDEKNIFSDKTGVYQLSKISKATPLETNTYTGIYGAGYFLASPFFEINELCYVHCLGTIGVYRI